MSKQKTPRTFVHTITVGGVVYILRFEELEARRYTGKSLTAELNPFEIADTGEGWRIAGDVPHKERFETLLKPRLDEEVA